MHVKNHAKTDKSRCMQARKVCQLLNPGLGPCLSCPCFVQRHLLHFLELLKMCFHFFEVFVICEVMAYLAVRALFGFVVVNYFQLWRFLQYFDHFSDSLILKLKLYLFFHFFIVSFIFVFCCLRYFYIIIFSLSSCCLCCRSIFCEIGVSLLSLFDDLSEDIRIFLLLFFQNEFLLLLPFLIRISNFFFEILNFWDYFFIFILKQEFKRIDHKSQIALYWIHVEITSDGSSHLQMFFKTGDLKNLAIFKRKHLCFLTKLS